MNISIASLQDRLRKVAKSTGKDFQLILTRYFQERLLFRLSQTPHRDNFRLKGGALHRRGNHGTAEICGVANQSPGFAWYDAATDEN